MYLTDIFPTTAAVQRLRVSRPDTAAEDVDFWVWYRSLQGLINRAEPHLYIVCRSPLVKLVGDHQPDCEEHWLKYYNEAYGLPIESIEFDSVLEEYKHLVEGYVVYDAEDVIQTQNLAITRAGLESLLPIAPNQEHWMTKHGIPKRDDLRGEFSSDAEAAEWAIDTLWPHCDKRMYANFCIHRPNRNALFHELEDYVVCHKGLALDLPLSRISRRTRALYRRMLESAEAPGVQMNWHCAWDQEKEYVAEAAKNGFFTLCSVFTPNLTIHGGVGDPEADYAQPLPEAPSCKADPKKVYVCLYNSDGDATWAMHNLHSWNWHESRQGSFKFGWGFLPLMVKLTPGMLRYYHETRTPYDCFWGPSSGVGYTYSHLWPKHLVDIYLRETRRLLNQSGQNGCNMVNWYLQDWWREVEDDEAIRREQEALKDGPGLVCGLGGSPYARNYLQGPIPKVHSVHIANAGQDNLGDIVRFSQECPTRPAFMFLFAQISPGIWKQLDSEMAGFKQHPEIEILSMDEFAMTLQDALERGLLKDELYETNDTLAETWLKAPGRNRLPLCERLTDELAHIAHATPEERRAHIEAAAWTDLVSMEVEQPARDRETFLTQFRGRRWPNPQGEGDQDALLYVAFTVAWSLVRAAILAQGIYANHRTQCLDDFKRTCGEFVDIEPFQALFSAWENWDAGAPEIAALAEWCGGIAAAAHTLVDRLGPDEDETFANWPPRSI